MFKKKFFGSNINPACEYCSFSMSARDGKMMLCEKMGVVSTYFSCKKYQYDPLKRIPKRMNSLPKFEQSDFEL